MPFFKLTLKEQIGEREWWYTYLVQAESEKIAQGKARDYAQDFYGETEDEENVPAYHPFRVTKITGPYGFCGMLAKPFQIGELSEVLYKVMEEIKPLSIAFG